MIYQVVDPALNLDISFKASTSNNEVFGKIPPPPKKRIKIYYFIAYV